MMSVLIDFQTKIVNSIDAFYFIQLSTTLDWRYGVSCVKKIDNKIVASTQSCPTAVAL